MGWKERAGKFWNVPIATLTVALILLYAESSSAETKPHWFSGRVVNGRTIPSSSKAELSEEGRTAVATTPVLFDVVVSLYNEPAGDNDGDTQGNPGSEDQDVYERIFQYFADTVYESTDGAHKIRRIRIYRNGEYASQSDIFWNEAGHPNASLDGISASGQHINMFDTFTDGNGAGNDLNFLTDEIEGAGYTLGHEWGHYAYGVYDEYEGDVFWHPIGSVPRSGDDPPTPAIMNYQWGARGGNYEWLNFSIAAQAEAPDVDPPWENFENTSNTAQHRMREASCWETLARPTSQDPRTGFLWSRPDRTHFPELASVAPAAGSEPSWPDLPGTARSDLDIIWMADELVYQIVIDRSGSMCGNKMENAKTASKLLIDLAEEGSSKIGVIQFDDVVEVVTPITDITDQTTKDAIKAQIDTITCRGNTAIGDAAQKALDDLLALGTTDDSKAVFLLTDGLSNSGVNPLSVIPAYQSAQIPIMAFAYGSGADVDTLRQMAEETGGSLYISPTTLAEVTLAFQDANLEVSPSVGVASASQTVLIGTPSLSVFMVDSTFARLDVTAIHDGNSSVANVEIIDPDGMRFSPDSIQESGGETLRFFSVDMPVAGEWVIETVATGADIDLQYQVSCVPAETTYSLSVESLGGSTVEYPEPIVLMVTLEKGLPIAGATVNAKIVLPDGTENAVELFDDGVAPDAVADNGTYSAILDYDQSGLYEIFVQMDNRYGAAVFTYNGLLSPDVNGEQPPQPPDTPVSEDFERFARLQITIQGVVSDDHGNTPPEASILSADNVDIAGKIDYPDDVDMFELQVPLGTDTVIFRVTDLALGMDPRLRIYDTDGVTVLAEGTLADAESERGYVSLFISTSPQTTLYAEVTHIDPQGSGIYRISAGAALAGDQPAAEPPVNGGGGDVDDNDGWGPFDCFIATAAYGSPMAHEVDVLREFRDKHLLTNSLGERFVEFYYRTSPAIASVIAEHEALRVTTRLALTPVVWTCKVWIKSPLLGSGISLLGVVGALAMLTLLVRRKTKRIE